MHKSPSLFFDILVEDDEFKRDEKIKRASFEIKSTLVAGSPGPTLFAQQHAAAIKQGTPQHVLQQNLLATAGNSSSSVLQPPTPAASCEAPAAAAAAGRASAEDMRPQSSPLQQGLAGAAGLTVDTTQPQFEEEQRQQQAQRPPLPPQQLQTIQQHLQQQQERQLLSELVLSPQEVLQELLGDLFISDDRIVMGSLLGQGGFADVHQAELIDPLLGFTEPVAVKRLRPDVLKGPDDLKEFLTEANLLRKLKHRNIVALRGVGATDLSDLVAMRESMFVVQEFMAGGDLKQLVVAAMARPFDPGYSKTCALTWAMQIAEAMHYLHSVCCPMIIHRDLKLDNVLLTGGPVESSMTKLADFGLHKRVRKMVSSGALVAWNQETTYHGVDYERSYYGGNMYLLRSAASIAGSVVGEGSTHSSAGGSLHRGGAASAALEEVAAAAEAPAAGPAGAPEPAQAAAASGLYSGGSERGRDSFGGLKGPQGLLRGQKASAAGGMAPDSMGRQRPPLPAAVASPFGGVEEQQPVVVHSDSAASFQQAAAAGSPVAAVNGCCSSLGSSPGSPGLAAQQHELMSAVRAKSQGLLGKQEFVTRVLSAAAGRPEVLQESSLQRNRDVSRTIAAVQALEGSVRAGNAFAGAAQQAAGAPAPGSSGSGRGSKPYQQQQHSGSWQSGDPEITAAPEPAAAAAAAPQQAPPAPQPARSKRAPQQQHPQQELCPQLLEQLHNGMAAAKDSQKFLEATQKVGSLMYMAPEVLAGHHYNEKIDVFSFGIILFELMSGVVIAGRVAMDGRHQELVDYARLVANGHREALPTYWPAAMRSLIAACWAQEPGARPGFREVLRQLYAMKQGGVDVEMDNARPKGNYNPVTDCGCSIM